MALNLNARTIDVDQVGKTTGRFILFIRCGQKYPLCLKDYADHEDVIVVLSQYQPIDFPIDKNCWLIRGGMSKFDAARLFFADHPDMLDFESFAFFDPDVGIAFPDLVRFLRDGAASGKTLYQAAVARDSSTYWDFLKARNGGGWREVSFVEVMAPIFSKEGLMAVIGGFSDSISTWGLEYHWYAKLKHLSMAVNDRFVMRHDSPVDLADGPFYRYLASLGVDPFVELKTLRTASVGKRFIECEIPRAIPPAWKKYYVPVLAECASQSEKLKYYSSRIRSRLTGREG
ncbi:hypothetical protein [uncultured Massilia sp.]|uniref:hypothetical protein n=1 Tax=uncultured Massilia sp. TaxID=169973 RepID=UPI0025CF88BE|nr:hypothetical protein [uncultured Massilia sp.]